MEYVPHRFNTTNISANSSNKNILIAVLDTGVDPNAYGLTKCPNGSNKIVDIVDCTDSDLVDTSTIKIYDNLPEKVKVTINDQIQDKNEIFYGTRSLRTFISDRQFKGFDEMQQDIINDLILQVYTYKYNDKFMTIVDTTEQIFKMGEYNFNQETGMIDLKSGLCYSFGVHVYENGKQTSLIFDTGSHATHVSGIIAGYFPDKPEQNGINPNAKILSLKIGDSRVDGMETSKSLCRALEEMVKHECYLANYSYGESVCPKDPSTLFLGGKFIDMLDEYSKKYNIIFCTSAGNSGPSLMTVGAPRMCTENVISVGAYTDTELLNNLYFQSKNNFNNGPYEWSSRGPAFNRSMGVDILAPGCALTSHPRWYKTNMAMCNGTSMACPSSVGTMSLILQNSQTSLPFYWVKKYFENSCEKINNLESFSQGHGLLLKRPMRFQIRNENYYYHIKSVTNDKHSGDMIYINESDMNPNNVQVTKNILINISPKLINSDDNAQNLVTFRKVLKIKTKLENIPGCTVTFPETIVVDSRGATVRIQIKINNDSFFNNSISEYVEFYEENDLDNFVGYYSVNIIKCNNVQNNHELNVQLNPGKPNRFYFVPKTNTFKISIEDIKRLFNEHSYMARFFIDVAKITDLSSYDDKNRLIENTVDKDFENDIVIKCTPGCVYEIITYTSWNIGITSNIPSVTLKLKQFNTYVNIEKHLLNLGETVNVELYSDNESEDMTILCELSHVITQYYPTTELINNNVLELTYMLNKHTEKCEYYVDLCNKVYNSDVMMSACIYGYNCDKLMFMGNYVPKKSNKLIDKVIIRISDKDNKLLQKYSELILNVKRELSTNRDKISKKHGNNIMQITLASDNLKSFETYHNDLIYCKLAGKEIVFINKCKQKEEKLEINFNTELTNFCKKLNMMCSKEEINKFLELHKDNLAKVSFSNAPLLKMLESLIGNTELKTNFYNVLKDNNLEKTIPYCSYKYIWKILTPSEVTLDEAIESFELIESNKNKNYWTDMKQFDFVRIKFDLLNKSDDTLNEKNVKKRKRLQYLMESNYGY